MVSDVEVQFPFELDEIVRPYFTGAKGSHAWDHTLRVSRLCAHIGPLEDTDMTVLLCAACLHDIGRYKQDETEGELCHAEEGTEMAKPIVEKLSLTDRQRENVLHAIATHRFRKGCAPTTIEAKILFDADKLDAIGAIGVARAFLFAGEIGARLHNPEMDLSKTESYTREDTGYREYKVKLIHIKDRMLTTEGKRIAQKRHEFMEAFFEQLQAEYEGKR